MSRRDLNYRRLQAKYPLGAPAPKVIWDEAWEAALSLPRPNIGTLAEYIRKIDPAHRLGSNELAAAILNWMPAPAHSPEPVAWWDGDLEDEETSFRFVQCPHYTIPLYAQPQPAKEPTILRKQAEAVEGVKDSLRNKINSIPGALSDKERYWLNGALLHIEQYAQRLRTQADNMETFDGKDT